MTRQQFGNAVDRYLEENPAANWREAVEAAATAVAVSERTPGVTA